MIAVWFSCGAASAAALKLTVEKYGATEEIRAVNNPVAEEDSDNLRFKADVEAWTGVRVERAVNPAFPSASAEDVWTARSAMSFPHGAPCTIELKKEARYAWEAENKPDWHVFGFTADEQQRHDNFVRSERENVLPVLIDAGMTKDDCAKFIVDAGLVLPRVYSEGFPNANCLGCVKATSPTYWNHLRRTHPDVFDRRAFQSWVLNVKLARVKGERVLLTDLDPNAKARPLKSLVMPDCNGFCEEGREE